MELIEGRRRRRIREDKECKWWLSGGSSQEPTKIRERETILLILAITQFQNPRYQIS